MKRPSSSQGIVPPLSWRHNRWVVSTVILTVLTVCSGPYYGWHHFQRILLSGGVYYGDDNQNDQIQNLYTVATACEFFSGVGAGFVFDHWGPLVCGSFGMAVFCSGVILFVLASMSNFKYYLLAMVFFGTSVNFISVPGLVVGDYFPNYQAFAYALVGAAQLACSLVGVIMFQVWQALPTLSFYDIWIFFFLAVVVPCTVAYCFVLPVKRPISEAGTGENVTTGNGDKCVTASSSSSVVKLMDLAPAEESGLSAVTTERTALIDMRDNFESPTNRTPLVSAEQRGLARKTPLTTGTGKRLEVQAHGETRNSEARFIMADRETVSKAMTERPHHSNTGLLWSSSSNDGVVSVFHGNSGPTSLDWSAETPPWKIDTAKNGELVTSTVPAEARDAFKLKSWSRTSSILAEFFWELSSLRVQVFTLVYCVQVLSFVHYSTTLLAVWGDSAANVAGYLMILQAVWGVLFGLAAQRTGSLPMMLFMISLNFLSFFLLGRREEKDAWGWDVLVAIVANNVANSFVYMSKFIYIGEIASPDHIGKLTGYIGFMGGLASLVNISLGSGLGGATFVAFLVLCVISFALVLVLMALQGIRRRKA